MATVSRVEDGGSATAKAVRPPLAGLSLAQLEARITASLDPVAGLGPEPPAGSDLDLNPNLDIPIDGLVSAAVLIPLVERDGALSVLFTQRADQLRRHAGQISFPGGRCEAGETSAEAALREAHEEIGLDPNQVRVAGLSTPYRTITGYHITTVVGFVPGDAALTLSAAEVAAAFEVPLAFLMDPANHERRHRDQPPGPPRWHYAITWREHVIWGATAGMVRALYDRLEGPDDAGA